MRLAHALVMSGIGGLLVAGSTLSAAASQRQPSRPNVVLIVADDLGFSDLGAFGGEIATPNLDQLAQSGVRLTDFHAAPACSPTRAMLLTGTDNHTAGVGAMAEVPWPHRGWGYEGHLTTRVATLAERLRENGYSTLMAGKWHLGLASDQDPQARGFDRSFALLQGAHNHFGRGGLGGDQDPHAKATYTENGSPVAIPGSFYSSDYFTSKMIAQLDDTPRNKPFFAYLAFTAPHAPLQAPAADIAKYKGRYAMGWEKLRERRLARMKKLGVIAQNVIAHPADSQSWAKLDASQQQFEARSMEVYAAMVDRMDQNVGRLVSHLKRTGRFANTMFVFLSDNGPAGETSADYASVPGISERLAEADHRLDAMGSARSFLFNAPSWALVQSAPFRSYKSQMTEGGTRVSAFITFAGLRRQGQFGRAYASVMDIAPTVLDVAKIKPSGVVSGRMVAPIRGTSMLPYLTAKRDRVHPLNKPLALELHGHRAVRQGDWKLLRLPSPVGDNRWALYNLRTDPAERIDLSGTYPQRTREMLAAWEEYARQLKIPPLP